MSRGGYKPRIVTLSNEEIGEMKIKDVIGKKVWYTKFNMKRERQGDILAIERGRCIISTNRSPHPWASWKNVRFFYEEDRA